MTICSSSIPNPLKQQPLVSTFCSFPQTPPSTRSRTKNTAKTQPVALRPPLLCDFPSQHKSHCLCLEHAPAKQNTRIRALNQTKPEHVPVQSQTSPRSLNSLPNSVTAHHKHSKKCRKNTGLNRSLNRRTPNHEPHPAHPVLPSCSLESPHIPDGSEEIIIVSNPE